MVKEEAIECNSLLQAFYYDEMDGVKKFGYLAIRNFLLSPRYQATVLLRWHRILYLRARKYHQRKGKFNALFFLIFAYLRQIVDRVNFTFNGGINHSPLARIGRYLFITSPMGISIAGDCVVGEHLIIHRGANLGEKNGKYPRIGKNVVIGASANILGGVKVGDNSVIGAMTLVIKDVDPNTIVAGIPARTLREIGKEGRPLF